MPEYSPNHEGTPGVATAKSRKATQSRTSAAPKGLRFKSAPITPNEAGEGTLYWIGTLPDCRVQNVTVGGVTFPRFTGKPAFDVNGKPDRPLQYGAEVMLTDDQLAAIEKGVTMRAIRKTGTGPRPRGIILMRDGPLPLQSGDEPLGRYLYMIEGHRGAAFPEPLED